MAYWHTIFTSMPEEDRPKITSDTTPPWPWYVSVGEVSDLVNGGLDDFLAGPLPHAYSRLGGPASVY
jgi:hypothetical protein